MNNFIAVICCLFIHVTSVNWHYNLDEAKQLAHQEHRYILLNFSGSDWCGPCIRMHKEIFETEVFSKMADSSLVLVNADFPRMRKNQLPAKQQDLNNAMADKYNAKGIFPLTLLLDADGKIIRQWEGWPNMDAAAFTQEVRSILDKNQ